MASLTLRGVKAGYGASMVLHGIDLLVEPGKICGVLGRNGVGKTTLIQSIAGHVPVKDGLIAIDGAELTKMPAHRRVALGLGLAPQGRRLFPSLTVREHLELTRRRRDGERRWDSERVLAAFPRLAERLSNPGSALSGGEQSMVSMGRLLMANPSVALLDEPSEGLSPLLVQQVGEVLRQCRDEGMAILLVEQNFGLVMKIDAGGRRVRRATANFYYYADVWNMQPAYPPRTAVRWRNRERSPKDLWWWVPGGDRYE